MAIPKPMDLLKSQLESLEKNVKKSYEAYDKGQIDIETHLQHITNNRPFIELYKRAILILTNNLFEP